MTRTYSSVTHERQQWYSLEGQSTLPLIIFMVHPLNSLGVQVL